MKENSSTVGSCKKKTLLVPDRDSLPSIPIRIGILGATGAGKSSIIMRYMNEEFSDIKTTVGIDTVLNKLMIEEKNNII